MVRGMTDEAVSVVWVDGVKLDIVSGDVSDFEERVRDVVEKGGGWLNYSQPNVFYRLRVSLNTSIIIRYPR